MPRLARRPYREAGSALQLNLNSVSAPRFEIFKFRVRSGWHQQIGVKLLAIIGFTHYYWPLLVIIAIIGYYWLLFQVFCKKFSYYWLLLRPVQTLINVIIETLLLQLLVPLSIIGIIDNYW